jgi:hypothetical protein
MSTTGPLGGKGGTAAKPNFFIVGAPKCGTTAWYKYLRSHPDVYFPDLKEPCYFAFDLPNYRVVTSQGEYAALYADAGDAKVIGDASAVYLMSEDAARGIHEHDPAAKILILLRRQEECLPSLHNQFLWEFAESIEDFGTAWRLSGRRPADTVPATCKEPRSLDYAAMGRFGEQVERYLQLFPRDQVMVLWFDEWVGDPRSTYRRVLDFLELDDDAREDFAPVHEGMTYRSRSLAQLLHHPPRPLRLMLRLVRRVTGISPETRVRLAQRVIGLLASPGYNKQIPAALREEIRKHYAEDNRRLNERLSGTRRSSRAAAQ